jgi:hypothetical protein
MFLETMEHRYLIRPHLQRVLSGFQEILSGVQGILSGVPSPRHPAEKGTAANPLPGHLSRVPFPTVPHPAEQWQRGHILGQQARNTASHQ